MFYSTEITTQICTDEMGTDSGDGWCQTEALLISFCIANSPEWVLAWFQNNGSFAKGLGKI